MFLCSLSDPGLTIFPTHRLLSGLREDAQKQEAIRDVLTRDFEIAEGGPEPERGEERVQFGYMDAHFKRPFRVTLKNQATADRALEGRSDAYRRLDTAV